jgi:hypothetical protein
MNYNDALKLAHVIIDMVEYDIRKEHPDVDQIAMEIVNEDNEKPNTLLYGEAYYALEDAIASKLCDLPCFKVHK